MGSKHFSIPSPATIETEWSLDDVLSAHDFLDLQDDLAAAQTLAMRNG